MRLNPIFSVIVPTCDRNLQLRKCLESLNPKVQSLFSDKYEVIVVDDSSQVDTNKLVGIDFPWVNWQTGAHHGPAANRNQGVKFAKGDWLVFCDDDCLADKQLLIAYEEAIKANLNCQVFAGRIYAMRPRESIAEIGPWNEFGGFLWSANFAIKKELFAMLGGFDERFPYASMEDVDLALRFKKSGNDFIFVQDASVAHPWKIRKNKQQLKEHRDSVMIYLALHPEELHRLNSAYYFYLFFRNLFKFTIPNLVRFGHRGIKYEIFEHLSDLKMAFLLLHYTPIYREAIKR